MGPIQPTRLRLHVPKKNKQSYDHHRLADKKIP